MFETFHIYTYKKNKLHKTFWRVKFIFIGPANSTIAKPGHLFLSLKKRQLQQQK